MVAMLVMLVMLAVFLLERCSRECVAHGKEDLPALHACVLHLFVGSSVSIIECLANCEMVSGATLDLWRRP